MKLRRAAIERINVYPYSRSGAMRTIMLLPEGFSAMAPGRLAWSTVTADDARFWQAESSAAESATAVSR